MQKSMQASLWLTWLVSLCSLSLVLLLTACGDPPAGTSRPTTPHPTVAATPTTDAQFTPNPILVGTGPAARTEPQLAYDKKNGTLVLFGGKSFDGYLQDTWTWDGTTWTQQHPSTAPSARLNPSMAYDATTHTVVLFGGDDMGAPIPLLTDTWTWDGKIWTQQHPATSPAVRFTSNGTLYGAYPTPTSMVWDEATQQVLLTLAGSDNAGEQKIQLSWIWDGRNWTQQSTQHVPEQEMCLFYRPTQRSVFAFASSREVSTFDDSMWQWNGQAWQPLAA